ncbi:hypothetical protein N7461_007320 [Penicillium sp. DV-2018c]|nr:hypothetical protein N7461_007320 [Penicillium sp. DV-2018c]
MSAPGSDIPENPKEPTRRWPKNLKVYHVYERLNVSDRSDLRIILHGLAKRVFGIAAKEATARKQNVRTMFMSKSTREMLQFRWRELLPQVPEIVKFHIGDEKLLIEALMKLTCALSDTFITNLYVDGAQEKETFDYDRAYVVPNCDAQIIRGNAAEMPIPIRLSDLLGDKGNPTSICPSGDWVNGADLDFELLRSNLTKEGFYTEGETIWLSPSELDTTIPASLLYWTPGEVRLTSLNFASSIKRMIDEHWPKLRHPSPDSSDCGERSPLTRPSLTIIVRDSYTTGGELSTRSSLSRPVEAIKVPRTRKRVAQEDVEIVERPVKRAKRGIPAAPETTSSNAADEIPGVSENDDSWLSNEEVRFLNFPDDD